MASRIDWIDDVIEGRASSTNFESSGSTWYPTADSPTPTTWTWPTTTYEPESLTYSTIPDLPISDMPDIPDRCSGNRWYNMSESFNRIVGGNTASEGDWPWIVNLSIGKKTQYNLRTASSSTAHCVGSILTDRFILTAGKCCDGSETSEVNIYAGSNNFYQGDLYE